MLQKIFKKDNLNINGKFKISSISRETKNEVFLQETYKAQNFIFRTSIGHYSITKRIFEMYLLEREQLLSGFL